MMSIATTSYHCSSNYYAGNNAKFVHRLTTRGSIDFSAPPEGYRYTATPVDRDRILELNLDPMFVTWHRFGAKSTLCYMELTLTSQSIAIEQTYKTEETKERRHNRCQIISKKTGKWITCPYDGEHSCSTCKIPANSRMDPPQILSLNALTFPDDSDERTFDVPADFSIEASYEEQDLHSHIRADLKQLDDSKREKGQRAMHLKVYDLWTEGYSFTEIATILGIKKASLHDDLVRIAKIIQWHLDH